MFFFFFWGLPNYYKFQGDKKETHDSLLDAGLPSKDEDAPLISLTSSSTTSSTSTRSVSKTETVEYTYDKAIQGYKTYAESTVKKLNSSMTSLNSNSSGSTKLEKDPLPSNSSPPKTPSGNVGSKLNFFAKEMDKEFTKPPTKPLVTMREKSPKVDITKRRTMFEMGQQSKSTVNLTSIDGNLDRRRSSDMTASTGNLKNRVASFENLDYEPSKHKSTTPPRDSKFKEKLASFNSKEKDLSIRNQKKSPEKDKNFHQKLASFSSLENGEKGSLKAPSKPIQLNSGLKSKIASFEQLDQRDQSEEIYSSENQTVSREKSVSMECLSKPPVQRKLEVTEAHEAHYSSEGCLVSGRHHATPYIEISLQPCNVACVKQSNNESVGNKRSTVYETVDVCLIDRDVLKAPMYSIFGEEVTIVCLAWVIWCTFNLHVKSRPKIYLWYNYYWKKNWNFSFKLYKDEFSHVCAMQQLTEYFALWFFPPLSRLFLLTFSMQKSYLGMN